MDDPPPPTLPPELERVIFELAAWCYPETIHSLILVARRVCIWIEPRLYHVFLCRSESSRDLLLRVLDSKPPEFLGAHVHHLALSYSFALKSQISRILSTCTSVHDLMLWTGYTYPELLSDLRNLRQLRRLSVNIKELFKTPTDDVVIPSAIALEPFAYLTHLDVFSSIPEVIWPFFQRLPRLTHLSISDSYIPALLEMALQTCVSLQALVVVSTQDEVDFAWGPLRVTDPRFCCISCPPFEDDWEQGALGKAPDFWARADAFIARKIRGEIEASVFIVPPGAEQNSSGG